MILRYNHVSYDSSETVRRLIQVHGTVLAREIAKQERAVKLEKAIIEARVYTIEGTWWAEATRRPRVAKLPELAEWIIGASILPVSADGHVMGTRFRAELATSLVYQTSALAFRTARHGGWLVVSEANRHHPVVT